ncbi:putative F-box protein At1g49610 isoform X2 [Setaria viridis]|uniref:putative F-box protein At1g49610 isoform X2 n=1 Tax=Setaria viridis TaxID=4556 RepID=UPI0014932E37|nr:putative F-box protein At1g49610 isoform X2 [Setaria viridis]
MEVPVAAPERGGDLIGALPDGVLEDIIGFLPAQDAVRTCVLARRWRHLWKSAKALHVVGGDGKFRESVKELREFVDYLLLSRGGAPLDTFELRFGNFGDFNFLGFSDEDLPSLKIWFWYVVTRKARVLRLRLHNDFEGFHALPELGGLPMASKHLTRLELHGVAVYRSFPDFSSCPALQHLEFNKCEFSLVKKISSDSLKYLSITESICGFYDSFRTHICAPNLVSLRLDKVYGCTPVLESMPSLVEAFVRIPENCLDQCGQWHANYWDCDCKSCDHHDNSVDGHDCCVLLKGLSEAKKLALFSCPVMYIFKRDLRCCPMFSKLKSLLLNKYWSEPDDLRALACILEHSPVLEKLTLQLFLEVPTNVEEMKGSPDPAEVSAAISECLQIVKVKCEVFDEKVLNVLKFLRKLGIRLYDYHNKTVRLMFLSRVFVVEIGHMPLLVLSSMGFCLVY